MALLEWCWEHRDAARYRELFTANYQFVPTAPDSLRVDVVDLAGRRVGRLMDQHDAPAGVYELTIGPSGEDGRRLGAGVYFYRIEHAKPFGAGASGMLP